MRNKARLSFRASIVFLITAILLASFPSSSQARLGEDATALSKRFGSPIETAQVAKFDFVQHIYKNRDLLIGVTLIDNKSASEQYTRTSGKKNTEGKPILIPIAVDIAQAILAANASNSEWKEIGKEDGARRFIRSDKEALAVFFERGGHISEVRISSSDFNRHLFPKVTE